MFVYRRAPGDHLRCPLSILRLRLPQLSNLDLQPPCRCLRLAQNRRCIYLHVHACTDVYDHGVLHRPVHVTMRCHHVELVSMYIIQKIHIYYVVHVVYMPTVHYPSRLVLTDEPGPCSSVNSAMIEMSNIHVALTAAPWDRQHDL